MTEFKVGDRVEGLGTHKGKSGEVVKTGYALVVQVLWDGGSRKSYVRPGFLRLED
jgi:hypothetical protein